MLQQKSKKIFIYISLLIIIGTINNKNFDNVNFTNVKKIYVKGLDEKKNLELIKKLDFLKVNNLFFLNEYKLTKTLNSNNLIENFSVFKIYPSTLDIKIKKTNFLAQLKKDDNIFFLGSNGKLTKTTETKIDIPFIIGDFKIKSFFKLKKTIDESNFSYNEINNLYFFKSGRWDIETNKGLLIKLPKDRLKKSLEIIINILAKDKEKKINIIDLRQYNQVIINE